MTAMTIEAIQEDRRAMSLATALAAANRAALAHGTSPDDSLITVNEEISDSGKTWSINYCPKDYIKQRGGDLVVRVDELSGDVREVLHGQ